MAAIRPTVANKRRSMGTAAPSWHPDSPASTSAESEPLYSRAQIEDEIFWDTYCTFEKQRVAECSIEQPIDNWWKRCIMQVEGRFFDEQSDEEREARWQREREERVFWEFFIKRNKYMSFAVLLMNCIALCGIVIPMALRIIVQPYNKVDNDAILAMLLYACMWLFYSFICLLFMSANIFLPSATLKLDMYRIWMTIGNSIFYSRVLIIVYNYGNRLVDGTTCYSQDEHMDIGNFEFMFYLYQISLDLSQVSVLSTLPFRWPWAVYFGALQFVEESLRVFSCLHEVFGGQTYLRVLNVFAIVLASTMFTSNMMSSYSFERCMRASYQNIQEQNKAAQEKMNLVNMLCRDIKAPAQQFIQIFKSLEPFLETTPIGMHSYLSSLQVLSSTINLVVDDLLFLVRVEEGRFRFACQDVVQVKSSLKQIYSALVSTSMQGSVSFVNESMFDSSQVHMETITTDKNCFQVLMYYSLIAVLELLKIQNGLKFGNGESFNTTKQFSASRSVSSASEQSAFHSDVHEGQGSRVRITFVGSERSTEEGKEYLRFSIRSAFRLRRIPGVTLAMLVQNSTVESSRCICQKIADSFRGHWYLYEDRIEFTLLVLKGTDMEPFSFDPKLRLDSSSGSSHSSVHTLPSSRRVTQQVYAMPMRDIKSQLRPILQANCVVYVNDPTLEHLLMEFIHRLPNGLDIAVMKHLSAAELKLYQIVFVQSIRACLEVREKGFTGKIVLCSERLTYLDEREKSHFDFGLSLPCSEVDFNDFLRYAATHTFAKPTEDTFLHKQTVEHSQGALRSDSSLTSIQHASVRLPNIFRDELASKSRALGTYLTHWCWQNPTPGKYQHSKLQLFVNVRQIIIPSNLIESYTKWRFVSPGATWFHHTHFVPVLVISSILVTIFSWAAGVIHNQFGVVATIYMSYVLIRRPLYHYYLSEFIPLHRKWWIYNSCLDVAVLLMSIARDFLYFTRSSAEIETYKSVANMTFHEFVTTQGPHGITGSEIVYFLVYINGWIKLFGDLLPWPVCILITMLQSIRVVYLLRTAIIYFLPMAFINYLTWLMVFTAMVIMQIQYYNERLYRQEFLMLHELILAKDVLEKCLHSSRRGLASPIQQLNHNYERFVQEVNRYAFEGRVELDLVLLQKLEMLQLNIMISKELGFALRVADSKYFQQPMMKFIQAMTTHYVRNIVQHVCTRLLSNIATMNGLTLFADLPIQIYIQLHPSLTLINVDESLLHALLSNTCRIAIERIQEGIQHHARERGYQHQLLLWIEPSTKQSVQRFTDVRVMEVTVFDTSEVFLEDDQAQLQLPLPARGVQVVYGYTPNGKKIVKAIRYHRVRNMTRRVATQSTPLVVGGVREANRSLAANPGGSEICNKYLKYFSFACRYESGRVFHDQYHRYQRFFVPYMVCPDSFKYQQWFLAIPTHIDHIDQSLRMKYYRQYCDIKFNFQMQHRPSSASIIASRGKQATRTRRRKFEGWAVVFCRSNSDLYKSATDLQEIFACFGWRCHVTQLQDLPNQSTFAGANCVIIEEDLITRRWSYNYEDILHYLKFHRYNGLTVVASTPKYYVVEKMHEVDDGEEGVEAEVVPLMGDRYETQAELGLRVNRHPGVGGADMLLSLPISSLDAKDIIRAAEKHAFAQFLSSRFIK